MFKCVLWKFTTENSFVFGSYIRKQRDHIDMIITEEYVVKQTEPKFDERLGDDIISRKIDQIAILLKTTYKISWHPNNL